MATKRSKKPGKRAQSGAGGRRRRRGAEVERPNTLLDAYAYLYGLALKRGRSAQRGGSDGDRDQLLRMAMEVAGKIRDSALGAEAAELASWSAVRDLDDPPEEPLAGALWLVAQCLAVCLDIERGCELDIRATAEALRLYRAAVAVEPLEARVEAGRMLREGRAVEKRAPGPTPVPTARRRALRLSQ